MVATFVSPTQLSHAGKKPGTGWERAHNTVVGAAKKCQQSAHSLRNMTGCLPESCQLHVSQDTPHLPFSARMEHALGKTPVLLHELSRKARQHVRQTAVGQIPSHCAYQSASDFVSDFNKGCSKQGSSEAAILLRAAQTAHNGTLVERVAPTKSVIQPS